jgi:hypothetical protein
MRHAARSERPIECSCGARGQGVIRAISARTVNTSVPITAPQTAQISTAPAATFFAFSTSGWNSGEATSHKNSNAVFSASAVQTDVIARTSAIHSTRLTRAAAPLKTTIVVATA